MLLKQKVMSGLAWSAGGRFLAQLITWGITIVVIRLLLPADYGLMALASVFVAFLAMLNELGMGAAIVQRKELDQNTLRSVFSLVLLSCVLFYLLLVLSAPLIANFYDEPRLILLVRVLAVEFLLMGFTVLPRSLLMREMKFRHIATVDFASAIAGSLTTLALALTGHGVWSLVWGTLMIRLVSMVGLNIYQPFLCLPNASMKGVWAFLSFGGYVTISRIIWYLYSRADILIIGKVLGKEMLGFYSIGLLLATLPMEKVSGIITQVAFPAFSSIQAEPGMAGRHFLKAVRIMSLIAFPVLWGMSSVAPEIVEVFLGAHWSYAVLPMQIIALVIPLRLVSNLMSTAVLGVGRPDISFQIVLVPFFLMPMAFFVGSLWGILGVSLAWVITFPLVFCLQLLLTIKALEVRFFDVFQTMKMPLLAAVIMYACVYFAKIPPILLNIHSIFKMLILAGFGAFIYFFITILLNSNGLKEARELLKV